MRLRVVSLEAPVHTTPAPHEPHSGKRLSPAVLTAAFPTVAYRVTSLIRNRRPLGPYGGAEAVAVRVSDLLFVVYLSILVDV